LAPPIHRLRMVVDDISMPAGLLRERGRHGLADRAHRFEQQAGAVLERSAPLTDVAVAYVRFALERPALFRVMFAEPCDRDNDERVAAIAAVKLYLREIVARCFPGSDPEALAPAIWALVHGLAFLFLDGKLDAPTPAAVPARVAATVEAVLGATGG
jgi:hypothetical protein